MTGFSAEWLAARETTDARARSVELLARLPRRFTRIVDLGAGTGSNLRWLAPRLALPQRWLLLDSDAELLAAAQGAIEDWSRTASIRVQEYDAATTTTGRECTFVTGLVDLAHGLAGLDLPAGSLVTASALLDLVSRDWLSALVARVADSGADVLWALSYDGSIGFSPEDDFDERIVALQNRHQLTDKGFGPALGPAAWRVAGELLEAAGYRVHVRPSVWHCEAADRALLVPLIEGWCGAAVALSPSAASRISGWRDRRLQEVEAGALTITVGHRDLAASRRD